MSVSYVSKTFKSSPYVLPLDLGLFQQVMSVKQQQFNAGQAKEQAQIDQMASLDVMRDVDREYLNTKINGIINTVNDLGGIDYSDLGTQNQIEGLGSDVYGDNKVITAISSTKSARNLIAQYENFKTNPKLKGYYSEANETLDKKKINQWMNNPNVGEAYQGPSSATPYAEYQQSLAKQMEKIQADQYTYLSDKGLFLEKKTGKFVTPERVRQAAIDFMTPAQAAQMKRDGIYQFEYINKATPEQLVNKAIGHFQEKVSSSTGLYNHYTSLANAAVADPEARQKYLQLAEVQKQELTKLEGASKTVVQNAVDAYKNDPEGMMGQLYTNDFVRGLSNIYSYNRVDRSVQEDKAEMFQIRQNEDARQFNLTYEQKERMEEQRNAIEMFKAGAKYITDENGKKVLAKIPPGENGSLYSYDNNTQDPDDLVVSQNKLLVENKQAAIATEQTYKDIFSSLYATNPNMFNSEVSQNATGGWLRSIKGQASLEGRNGKPGFQPDDLAGLDDYSNRESIKRDTPLNDSELDQLSTWYKDYSALLNGQKPTSERLPQQFIDGVEKVKLFQTQINTNNATMTEINSAALNKVVDRAELTPEEKEALMSHPQKYAFIESAMNRPATVEGVVNFFKNIYRDHATTKEAVPQLSNDENLNRALQKIVSSGAKIKSITEEYYKARGSRNVRSGRIFNQDEVMVKNGTVSNFIAVDARTNGIKPLGDAPVITSANLKAANIKPQRSGISSDGRSYIDSEITIGTGDNTSTGSYRVFLDDKNAQTIGIYTDPYEVINQSLFMRGKSDVMPISGGKNLSVNVIIQQDTDNINDGSAQAYAQYDVNGHKVFVAIPETKGQTGSESYSKAKAIVRAADSKGVTWEEFRSTLNGITDNPEARTQSRPGGRGRGTAQ